MARIEHKKTRADSDTRHMPTESLRQSDKPTPLDESTFIRSRLFANDKSAFARYRELVFRDFTWLKLIRYEFLITFFGPVPGALGFALRKAFFRSLFRSAGKGVLFGRNLTLHHTDCISLGNSVMIDRDCVLDARGAGDEGIALGDRVIVNRGAAIQAKIGHIEIGNDCNIGAGSDIVSQGPIILGNNVSIAGKVIVAGGRYVVEQNDDAPGEKKRFSGGAIRIGDNVRIGMGAIIQDGVAIGENAIVAPGSVVYHDVAADSVVWGNPARPLRSRSTQNAAGGKQSPADTRTPELEEIRQKVRTYLEGDLFVEFGDDLGFDDSLLDSGIMDSLALVRLLLWIEKEFDVDLDFSALDPSEIDSVEKIVSRIDERRM